MRKENMRDIKVEIKFILEKRGGKQIRIKSKKSTPHTKKEKYFQPLLETP